ncbi:uncharacterized protein KY384_004798 [Bacidia gigantensis]|uniref:uncharacterized protein n=1 Tax=Bacidia gigantensis TaxID=2732470 RepID=UPI001D04899B|nr:uncharacterized protein KY384_004798 [Bacidia gigantensis]KAG8530296.1 hypothetical protein KY384_004798 [Bacidia gigantensis]
MSRGQPRLTEQHAVGEAGRTYEGNQMVGRTFDFSIRGKTTFTWFKTSGVLIPEIEYKERVRQIYRKYVDSIGDFNLNQENVDSFNPNQELLDTVFKTWVAEGTLEWPGADQRDKLDIRLVDLGTILNPEGFSRQYPRGILTLIDTEYSGIVLWEAPIQELVIGKYHEYDVVLDMNANKPGDLVVILDHAVVQFFYHLFGLRYDMRRVWDAVIVKAQEIAGPIVPKTKGKGKEASYY